MRSRSLSTCFAVCCSSVQHNERIQQVCSNLSGPRYLYSLLFDMETAVWDAFVFTQQTVNGKREMVNAFGATKEWSG